jgi:hypothetical protein
LPCGCKQRRQWVKTRIVDPATGKLVQVLKTIRDPTMSLTNRLNEIERRLKGLEQWKDGIDAALDSALVEEVEQEAEPDRTLEGDQVGGERDQLQPL